jgi:hypothetical protein
LIGFLAQVSLKKRLYFLEGDLYRIYSRFAQKQLEYMHALVQSELNIFILNALPPLIDLLRIQGRILMEMDGVGGKKFRGGAAV